ncbi:MAG: tRNA epoxyqueuosine(34) reductase QueG [Pirellulales bacterium]|nr:tRNA epoxyqueuosine(34) reductase QueG [Pirellulales bacterium]
MPASVSPPQRALNIVELTSRLRQRAQDLGFDLCGVCPALTPGGLHRFAKWLDAGYAGEMKFLDELAHAHETPGYVLDGARSLVILAMNYNPSRGSSIAAQAGEGRVANYAVGADYHDVIHDRLKQLRDWLHEHAPGAAVRGVVDSAPLMEREFAQLAGLGWIGKNTLLLNRRLGSWFFLAVLLTDLELQYDAPTEVDHCGTCTACLEACPTDAFVAPYVLDARKCISYLTIEHRSTIPVELRSGMEDWIFGCDVCQEVCPWNNHAPASREDTLRLERTGATSDLCELLQLSEVEFRERFRGTPLWRAKRRGLLRNAAIVLGNQRHAAAVPVLTQALDDEEPLIRAAAAWALGQIGGQSALQALRNRRHVETTKDVRGEIKAAIAQGNGEASFTAFTKEQSSEND